jgi:D-alanyl-lipoteichoic acid acyltransferase DltB (MBOAT superfamily)
MLFVEPRFLLFFAVVAAAYWAIPSNVWRKRLLLVASYGFYAAWDWRFLALIGLTTTVDWNVARWLGQTDDATRRRHLILLSLVVNLGVLFTFKYLNFFADSTVALLDAAGIEVSWTTLQIVLPVGISFYTFQSLSYSIDVYRRQLEPRFRLSDFALYVAFFPQLVAGPIVRARQFLPQLEVARRFDRVPVRAALTLFLVGFFKKACVSDNISPLIDPVFAAPAEYQAAALVASVLLYAVQIYCDFSGYSDMAIAVAAFFGYRLPRNFDWPYFADGIIDFWRRWHMSLSSWLRDYLYIPLGGNRFGETRRYRNLLLTMLLGGLWHGASWNFVIWGALHGGILAIAHGWRQMRGASSAAGSRNPLALGFTMLVTFWWTCLAWIFFRAPDLATALEIARAWLWFESAGTVALPLNVWPWLAALLGLHAMTRFMPPERRVDKMPPAAFAIAYGAATAIVLAFLQRDIQPFVYFQF